MPRKYYLLTLILTLTLLTTNSKSCNSKSTNSNSLNSIVTESFINEADTRQLVYTPEIGMLFRTVVILFKDDNFVEGDEKFSVIFSPENALDRFNGTNVVNVTITDDESEKLLNGVKICYDWS